MKNLSPIEKLIKAETYASMSSVLYQQLGKFGDNLSEKIKDDIREQAEYYQRESEAFRKKASKQLEP